MVIAASLVVVIVLGAVGMTALYSKNMEQVSTYETAHSELLEVHQDAEKVLERAMQLEPDIQEELENGLATVADLLSHEAPGGMSFGIRDRIAELERNLTSLDDPVSKLNGAITRREDYDDAISIGEKALAEAESVLKKSKGKVKDDEAYSDLKGYVAALHEALENEPNKSSGHSYAERTEVLSGVSEDVTTTAAVVSSSHDDWAKAEEEASKKDPANYKTLSERDWLLVERDPDAHEGEKYVLYGAVTQADSATGNMYIRINTGATKQSRQYNYDVNTIVLSGSEDIFSNVVQGDHVKILVEVAGAMSYDTTIGGSATAVMVLANDLEVIGQF